ncbi:uncharacterized protein DUF3473 [Chitinophaga skermanii]|uniref:Uncharacterized protein DUF3473 n=1 Tax=Chitinophaga skermanii TaxID=331697 RepID=A0A327QKA9_9BACT|nr:polysaccharide deacetylase family protein [Chitinophaga skermanii]RAJ05076.1 uncharacterized protein DUF3473 [Chitinophaga skermanii]
MQRKQNKILISVDVEEFDIPEEYGQSLTLHEKMGVSYRGLMKTLALFEAHRVKATFFITAYWAQHYPNLVQQIARHHEIASHAFYHHSFNEEDLHNSRQELQLITGKPVYGFRMPRLKPFNTRALKKAGYTYDASINPTWLPGRYNNRHLPRTVYRNEDMLVVPSSVTPLTRYPIFWLSMKNMPLWVTKHAAKNVLQKDGYLSFYFHPWEMEDLSAYDLPSVVKRVSGTQMQKKMDQFLKFLGEEGNFSSHIDYLQQKALLYTDRN